MHLRACAEEAPTKRARTDTAVAGSSRAAATNGTARIADDGGIGGGGGVWRLRAVQPWADKAVKPAQLTEEQAAHLAEVAKEKAEKEASQQQDKPVRIATLI